MGLFGHFPYCVCCAYAWQIVLRANENEDNLLYTSSLFYENNYLLVMIKTNQIEMPACYIEVQTETHSTRCSVQSWTSVSDAQLLPLYIAKQPRFIPSDLHLWLYIASTPVIASTPYTKGILPKGPYLPCVSMAGRALLAGYPRHSHSAIPGKYGILFEFKRTSW